MPKILVQLALAAALAWQPPLPSPEITVPPGADAQAAIDAAPEGAVLAFSAAGRYRPVVLKKRVTLQTTGLPLRETRPRLSPEDRSQIEATADSLATFRCANNVPAVRVAPGVHGVTLKQIAMRGACGDLVEIGTATTFPAPVQTELGQAPVGTLLDQVVILGDDGAKRGVSLHGAETTIRRSVVAGIRRRGQESAGIGGWNGPGPWTIENNDIEAASINILVGGANPTIRGLVAADVTVRGNFFTKNTAWRAEPAYAVKNLLELKAARRVTIEGNIFEKNWPNGQDGFALLFKVANPGGLPQAVTEDIVVRNNVVRDVSGGINVQGRDPQRQSGQLARLTVVDNFFSISRAGWGGSGWFLKMGGEPRDVTIEHNTIVQDGQLVNTYGAAIPGFRFVGNLAPAGLYTFFLAGAAHAANWRTYFPGGAIEGNTLADASRTAQANLAGNTFITRARLLAAIDEDGRASGAFAASGRR
jgi:hypothetical protein